MNSEFTILISAQLVSTITIIISIIALFMHLSKKIDNVSKELSDFKTEVRVELVKFQSRFDKYDGVHTDIETRLAKTETQVAELKTQTAERINQLEADNKLFIKELFQSVESGIKRPPVL